MRAHACCSCMMADGGLQVKELQETLLLIRPKTKEL